MKFLISQRAFTENDFQKLEQKYKVQEIAIGPYNILKEKETEVYDESECKAFIDGYIRDFNVSCSQLGPQIQSAVDLISKQWPVPNSISGSFSAAIIQESSGELIICNDAIGVYPLYYLTGEKGFYISNSLTWLGAISETAGDEVGLFQRAYCPEFANIGSRTILKDVKRLLPGEWIRFGKLGSFLEKKYDNELYRELSKNISPSNYWQAFKKELSYCLAEEKNLHIALSGGMDSRLLIGGVSKSKKVFCHTYGDKDFYETRIAKRIAEVYDADFKNYSQPQLNFPEKKILEKYTIETEAVYINNWLEILEEQDLKKKESILVGDMTESLQGRNLPMKKNWKNFNQYYLGRKEYSLTGNTRGKFEDWKRTIIEKYTGLAFQKHIDRLNLNISERNLKDEIIKDLEKLIDRIEAHNLAYMELVTELFSWFTHSRIPMGKQILILNSKFKAYCVPMSIQILRLTSNIHPGLRVGGRYIKSLFTSVAELRPGARMPTAQIPFVAFKSPEIFKLPIWFLRSEIDDFLIKRLMKSANPKKRYRLLKSFNWVKVYQQPQMETRLRSYFKKSYLGEEYTNAITAGALARKNLKQWPLSNTNIINAAALNEELALIKLLTKNEI
ncbi:Glutamine amidotransferase domain-containing protein [Salegentibacter holothuriorum]|uniref:asparagine synthase (glutamine-hydrolyzing) n=1 Tax=Salegentibacter holothuriorum TaxID=241145 RepID=A0A1T5CLV4_9FLAO|nr:hypothetical protein [Salegentibacter holothuriorum]SKB60336.1 Glutamine amidotransferase domain-containing protein [Salegentibacter holothuriorum]